MTEERMKAKRRSNFQDAQLNIQHVDVEYTEIPNPGRKGYTPFESRKIQDNQRDPLSSRRHPDVCIVSSTITICWKRGAVESQIAGEGSMICGKKETDLEYSARQVSIRVCRFFNSLLERKAFSFSPLERKIFLWGHRASMVRGLAFGGL
jgi:hypothetical protein